MAATFLKAIHTIDQAPSDGYVIYNMAGGILCCSRANYKKFSRLFVRIHQEKVHLTLDLCSAQSHSLFFDVDCKVTPPTSVSLDHNVVNTILSILKVLLLPSVHDFTMIVSMRPNSAGIHVHLPEFAISHDDYIRLCEQLQPQFHRVFRMRDSTRLEYTLDIPVNFSLANSSKPGQDRYEPCLVLYVDEGKTVTLDCSNMNLKSVEQQKFKRTNQNSRSFFRKLMLLEELDIRYQILEFTMPVATPYEPLYKISYQTEITVKEQKKHVVATADGGEEEVPEDVTHEDLETVAEFTFKQHPVPGKILKGNKLRFDGYHWLKSHTYLKYNSYLMETFTSNNHALHLWQDRIRQSCLLSEENHNPVFRTINDMLKSDNYKFHNDPNPLKSVLEYDDGYYFLPTFYALTQHLRMNSSELVQNLRGMLHSKFHSLLDKIERIPDRHVELASKQFTINTVLFCGHNLYKKFPVFKDKLQMVFVEMKRQILNATSKDALIEVLRTVQQRHFPIMVITLAFSVKKPIRFVWNALQESWQEVASHQDVAQLMTNIWERMRQFIQTFPTRMIDDEVFKEVHVGSIVASIMSESSMERKVVQMDRHKWLIRTNDGTLDVLTRHIGGTVPEHFISERRLAVHIDRKEMVLLHDRSSHFWRFYELLTSKSFFYRYLKACLCDVTDDLTETLREILQADADMGALLTDQPRAESMLRFYVHLCKYSTFDYDTLMYLLDVLSSLFVATNYARKFFILKGVTKNGKSKLFQIISRVYGAYCAIIRPDNIRPHTTSLGPMPELASTLFSSRIVVFDEIGGKLNENLIKEITGNSTVSFRNMYEQNQGGIPTAKIFASTNTIPVCTATTAFRDRVVAIPFEATFVDKAPSTTSEQVMRNEYPLDTDESLVEHSHEGFFMLTYFHFIQQLNVSDATVHYRPEPERLKEFKEQYLAGTNVYEQFKLIMDVQVVNNDSMTTMNELTSAIRQFLSSTKNSAVNESDLKEEFDKEFHNHRRTDVVMGGGGCILDDPYDNEDLGIENDELSYSDVEEEQQHDEPKPKKRRKSPPKPSSLVILYYHNVTIRNMRRVHSNDV